MGLEPLEGHSGPAFFSGCSSSSIGVQKLPAALNPCGHETVRSRYSAKLSIMCGAQNCTRGWRTLMFSTPMIKRGYLLVLPQEPNCRSSSVPQLPGETSEASPQEL